jgi:hypothetical protein
MLAPCPLQSAEVAVVNAWSQKVVDESIPRVPVGGGDDVPVVVMVVGDVAGVVPFGVPDAFGDMDEALGAVEP